VAFPFGPAHKVQIRSNNIGLQTMCNSACGTTLNGAVPTACSLGEVNDQSGRRSGVDLVEKRRNSWWRC
jgi:hypothetical protein